MRNFKKMTAVVVALALVLTTFVQAFAAYAPVNGDKALVLKQLELYQGTSTSSFVPSLETELTRGQGALLLTRLFNMESAAQALTDAQVNTILKGFADASKVPTYAKKSLAYLVSIGIMNGALDKGKLSVDADASLLGAQFATMMLRQMGYTVDVWKTGLEQLAQVTGAKDLAAYVSYEVEPLLRDQAVGTMYGSLTANYADGSATIIEKIVAAKPELKDVAVAAGLIVEVAKDLAVESVNALNTKQVLVVFNKEVDATTAGTATNYTIGGVAFGKADLQADNKSVILTLAGETKMVNAGTADIKVLKAVKDAAGTALVADYAKTITITDTKLPEVVSIKATGLKTFVITFDEPVYDAVGDVNLDNDQITLKSGIYTYVVTAIKADYAANTLTVTTGTNLLAGDVVVKINAQGMTDGQAIRDFAGLTALSIEKTFTYAADTTTATASITNVNKETKKATVTFSKAVYGANVVLYHSVNGVAAYGTPVVTKTEANAATAWEFTFTNALPSGNLSFYLVNSATAADQLTDLYGVKVANQTLAFNVVADTIAPTVSTVTVNANTSIDIAFSEDVDTTEKVAAANYEILKADGTKLAFTTSSVDTKTVRLAATLEDNATYTVNVKAMKDAAGVAMAAVYTVQKTVGDNLNPTADLYTTANNTIYVSYSENMNQADITNKLNYLVDANDDGTYAPLGDNDSVTLVNAKKVKITWAAADFTAGTDRVQIGAVKDLAGKKLTSDSQFVTSYDNVAGDTLTFTAQVTALNKVKLTFNKVVSGFDNAEFTVTGSTISQIESMTVNTDGVTEVVLVLAADLAPGATPAVTTVVTPVNTKSEEATVLSASANVTPADKVAPIFTAQYLNATTIRVVFNKNIESDLVAAAGKNGFSVTGGTLTSALLAAPGDGKIIILRGTDFTANTDVTYTAGFIADTNANALATTTIADPLTVATITVVNAVADNTFTVTTNFDTTILVTGDITTGAAINGITYTATVDGAGIATIAAAGTATAPSAATTATFTITKDGVVKTVTMTIPAYAAIGDAAVVPTIAAQ